MLEDEGETRDRQVIAMYGLAALGEPVLVSLQALSKETDLTWRERLYVGLALVEVGDDTSAREVYQRLIDDYGEGESPDYRLSVDAVQDHILEATSLAASSPREWATHARRSSSITRPRTTPPTSSSTWGRRATSPRALPRLSSEQRCASPTRSMARANRGRPAARRVAHHPGDAG